MINSSKNIGATIIFFFVTLQSFYFYQIGLAPFPLLAFIMLLINAKNKTFDQQYVKICGILVLLFLLSGLVGLVLKLDFYHANSLLGIIIGPIFLLLSISLIQQLGAKKFSKVIDNVLVIHIIFFLIQFIGFFVFHRRIDYLQAITGEESRSEGFGDISSFARCTGLFNEPATYSCYIFFLVYCKYLCNKRLNAFDHLSLITVLLTLSISGILMFVFMEFFYWVIIKRNILSIVVFSVLIILIVFILDYFFSDTINSYILDRLTNVNEDASANTRFSNGLSYFFSLPLIYNLLGMGLGNYANDAATATAGWIAIITNFGVVLGLMFMLVLTAYFIRIKINFTNLLPFFMLLFSTIIPNLIIFWFILSCLSVYRLKLTT